MKSINNYYIVALIFTAFNAVRSDKSCLYGWHLSDDETSCYVHCNTSQLLFSNVYCSFFALKNVNFTYDSSPKIFSMPSGDSMGTLNSSLIPPCYNVTLQNDQYDVTPDGFIRIAPYLMEIPLKNALEITSTNVTLCYPSSPQLLQCDAVRAFPGSYEIVNQTVLLIHDENMIVFLGDFYVDDEASVFFCGQSSPNDPFTDLPRCNMAVLQHGEYFINSDGSMSVLPANVTIGNPLYSINYSSHAIVCFPLTFNFLNCPLKPEVSARKYKLFPNFTVWETRYGISVDPYDYYIAMDSLMTLCVHPVPPATPLAILRMSYDCLYFLSSLSLLLTLMFKFKMFVRNYHNLCLLCHALSLTIMYFSLGTPLFYTELEVATNYLLFFAYYFSNMAVLFWLNVIVYDSWRFLSSSESVKSLGGQRDDCCMWFPCVAAPEISVLRFALYNLYSWGSAGVLSAVILGLDLDVSSDDFSYRIGHYVLPSCFFTTTDSFVVFFCLPFVATAVIDVIFLGLTIRILYRDKEGSEVVNVRKRKQMFIISLQVFIVIGFCWTVDCICFASSIYNGNVNRSWYWFLALGLTSVQGIVVSVIYNKPSL